MMARSLSEPAQRINNVLDRESGRILQNKEKSLRSAVKKGYVKSAIYLMRKSNDEVIKNLRRIAQNFYNMGSYASALKIAFIGSVYLDAKQNNIVLDVSSLLENPSKNLNSVLKEANSMHYKLQELKFERGVHELKTSIHKYGSRTRAFLADVIVKLEQLNETNKERSYKALGMVNAYISCIINKGIVKGHGREEIERAILSELKGSDSSKLFSEGFAKSQAYAISVETYKKYATNLPKSIIDRPEIKSIMDKMRGFSEKGDVDKVMQLSHELNKKIPSAMKQILEENKRSIINRSEKMGEHLGRLQDSLGAASGFKGCDSLSRELDALLQKIRKLRDSVHYAASANELGNVMSAFSSLAKEYSMLVKKVQSYNYVANMLLREKSYYDYLKQLDPGDARRMEFTYKEAVNKLNDALYHISKSNFSKAHVALSDALDAKMNMMAYMWSGSGKSVNDYRFLKEGALKLYSAFLEGIPNEKHMDLNRTLIEFESALRYSGERLFATEESSIASRMVSTASGLAKMQMDLIDGKEVDSRMLNAYANRLDSDAKLLSEKMNFADHANKWAEFAVSMFPPAFVAVSLKSVMREQYLSGNVSWENWAMLGMSVFSLGAVSNVLKSFRVEKDVATLVERSVYTLQISGGLAMLGVGAVGTYALFKEGRYLEGLEQLAMFSIPLFHAHFKVGFQKAMKRAKLPLEELHSSVINDIKIAKASRAIEEIKSSKSIKKVFEKFEGEIKYGEGARSTIPTSELQVFEENISRNLRDKNEHMFGMVLDKSALNSYNNISWDLGDSAIDAYVISLDMMGKLVKQKYKNVSIHLMRVSENSDEIYLAFTCKDVDLLMKLRKNIGKFHSEAIEETLLMVRNGEVDLPLLRKQLSMFRHEVQAVSSSAEISSIFSFEGSEVVKVSRSLFGKKLKKVPVGDENPISAMVRDAENNVKLTYKERFISKKLNFEEMRKKFNIKSKSGIEFKLAGVGENEVFSGHLIELKFKLGGWKKFKGMFGKLMEVSTRKGYNEVRSGYFGMRGLNTFFGHPGTDFIADVVEVAVQDFAKSKKISVKRISPFKYVITKGYTEALEAELASTITKRLVQEGAKFSETGINSVYVRNATKKSASDALICRAIGVATDNPTKFVENSNRIISILREYKPEVARRQLGDIPIYDDLLKIFSGDESRYIRNTEDLFAYFESNKMQSLRNKFVKTVESFEPPVQGPSAKSASL